MDSMDPWNSNFHPLGFEIQPSKVWGRLRLLCPCQGAKMKREPKDFAMLMEVRACCFLPFWAGLRSSLKKVHIEQIEPVGRFRTFLVNTDTTIMQKGPLADSKSYIPSALFHLFLATFSDEICHPPVIVEPPTTRPLRPQRWMACSGHSPLSVGLPAKKSFWRPKGWRLLKPSPVSPTWSSILYQFQNVRINLSNPKSKWLKSRVPKVKTDLVWSFLGGSFVDQRNAPDIPRQPTLTALRWPGKGLDLGEFRPQFSIHFQTRIVSSNFGGTFWKILKNFD